MRKDISEVGWSKNSLAWKDGSLSIIQLPLEVILVSDWISVWLVYDLGREVQIKTNDLSIGLDAKSQPRTNYDRAPRIAIIYVFSEHFYTASVGKVFAIMTENAVYAWKVKFLDSGIPPLVMPTWVEQDTRRLTRTS